MTIEIHRAVRSGSHRTSSSAAPSGFFRRFTAIRLSHRFRRAAGTFSLIRMAGEQLGILHRPVCFPRNTGGILYPGFFRPGVAADGFAFLGNDHVPSLEAFAQLCQFALFLDLDAKMIDALFLRTRGYREVHAGVFQQPFGIVSLRFHRLRVEQRTVKADRFIEFFNPNMDMKTFHDIFSYGWQQCESSMIEHFRFLSLRMLANSTRQQSSTMYRIRPEKNSKLARYITDLPSRRDTTRPAWLICDR